MIDNETEYYLEELSEIASQSYDTSFMDFPKFLRRWIYLLDDAPAGASTVIEDLVKLISLEDVKTRMMIEQRGMGSGIIDWPDDKAERLAAHQALLRGFINEELEYTNFIGEFFYSQHGDFNDANSDFVSKTFIPHVRELDRFIRRVLEGKSIPGSDRMVSINHNSPEYESINTQLEELQQKLVESNQPSEDERERLSAELSAGREIIGAKRARFAAVKEVLVRPLRYISSKFADATFGTIATFLLTLILSLFGISL